MRDNRGTTTLRRKRRNADPMQAYDRLPAELRGWLASAHLPWSPHSAKRAYTKALARTGDPVQALSHLDQIERAQISRDVRRLWDAEHPSATSH